MLASSSIADDVRPVDCVRQFPTLSPDLVQLIAFDWTGTARVKVELAAVEDLVDMEDRMLRWMRDRYGDQRPRLVG